MPSATLFYIHDPMCSWCWGYRPVLEQIRSSLKLQLPIINIVGGLAPDSDKPMPAEQQQQIAGYWKKIEQELGTEFNHEFWTQCDPRRSTYPACRAVLAAKMQDAEEDMILAIQHAYYLRAMNPSDEDTLLQLADELGLNFEQFMQDIASNDVQLDLVQNIAFTRHHKVSGFPSWLLQVGSNFHPIPLDYHSAHLSLAEISGHLRESIN